ncbi:MAG TPA: outer membrane beta-barrel protein, partial [Fimbriimonas sp.]
TPKLTLMGMLVQGWNEVEDSNGSKSVHVGAAYAATERLNIALNGYFGREGTKDGPVSGIGFAGFEVDTTLLDLVASYRLDPHTKLGLNVDLGEARGAGKFGGFALYGRKNLGADSAAAVRLEHTEDPEGLRTGLAANYRSLTATYDHQVAENLSLRFELRHDLSNRAAFVSEDGLRKNRTTLTFAQVLRF